MQIESIYTVYMHTYTLYVRPRLSFPHPSVLPTFPLISLPPAPPEMYPGFSSFESERTQSIMNEIICLGYAEHRRKCAQIKKPESVSALSKVTAVESQDGMERKLT